jgi:hypothetical protein
MNRLPFDPRATALVLLAVLWTSPALAAPPAAASASAPAPLASLLPKPKMTPRPPTSSVVAARCTEYGEQCDNSPCCAGLACVWDDVKYISVCDHR